MALTVDFDELPYDLFQLLEVSEECTSRDIKKAYKKAVLKYHPDKNYNANEEYFSWISLANKILSNPEHRDLYIEWKKWKDDHLRLRNQYKNAKINVDNSKTYQELEEELNKKHKFNVEEVDKPLAPELLNNKLKDLQNSRNNLVIPKENIKNMEVAINNLKKNQAVTKKQEILEYTGQITTLTNTSGFASLDSYNKLYRENDKVATDNVTSLSDAFKLSPYLDYTPDNITLEEKLKNYRDVSYFKKYNKLN
ncbi:putative DnaJ/Hsp40 [Cafeteria roenbergensis virus]|uniref:Putative DnaJ/Hsp40 n=1 Tax=Cafeteria roenbergensis virus (strain BV-PW1) TaxID=693272 RepID=E3T4U0_CROVB|nr:putative DnaJ/Hsp40 [Cafeteria roenbergensis virus BV-PW1]ADO67203.1 putative DnaJ/Hsp40 [Cafeteria roenbergensis virus BV-PW1]